MPPDYKATLESCLSILRKYAPELAEGSARLIVGHGQFNHILVIDERWIVRFPKSEPAAAYLANELDILPKLRGRLPLPIPAPQYSALDPQSGNPLFMAYPMLPGEPLKARRCDILPQDEPTLDALARDLADFLRALHAIPPAELDRDRPGR